MLIYYKDVNNIINKFVKIQRDSKYYNSLIIYNSSYYNIIRLSFYKLVQFLKNYINLQELEIPIVICLYIAWYLLYNICYKYKNRHKDIFIDRHEQINIIKDYKNFLRKIKVLNPYIVKFNKFCIIKPKIYLLDCIVGKDN